MAFRIGKGQLGIVPRERSDEPPSGVPGNPFWPLALDFFTNYQNRNCL